MFKPHISRMVRRLSILFILTACLLAVRSQPLSASISNSESQPVPVQGIKLEFKHRNDKIIKVIEVRNIDKESWLDDLEIELKNVSGKPIYLLELPLVLPELPPMGGSEVSVIAWSYGNEYLINNDRLAEPTEIPIKPDETFVYKIPKLGATALRKLMAEDNIPPLTRIVFEFYVINFGDGTGYIGGTRALERVHREKPFAFSIIPGRIEVNYV